MIKFQLQIIFEVSYLVRLLQITRFKSRFKQQCGILRGLWCVVIPKFFVIFTFGVLLTNQRHCSCSNICTVINASGEGLCDLGCMAYHWHFCLIATKSLPVSTPIHVACSRFKTRGILNEQGSSLCERKVNSSLR